MDSQASPVAENRHSPRRRTRMRPVKLVTAGLRFLCDGAALDLSGMGVRIKRHGSRRLPDRFLVFDEGDRTLRPAAVVWSSETQIGLQFCGPSRPAGRLESERIAGQYYALPD